MRDQLGALQSEKLELTELLNHRQPLGKHDSHSSINRSEMQRQIETLNRQIFSTSKNAESLEQVEAQLVLKLDKKEAENYQLKRFLQEMRQEVDQKTDAVQKAQKIIQRLSEKGDEDENLISRLQQEGNQVRGEIQGKTMAIQDLNA